MNYDRFKSLDDFKNAIEMGLDIEFFINNVRYNISWRDYKPLICTCPDGEAVFFKDADSLLNEYEIDGKKIKELWAIIEIYSM